VSGRTRGGDLELRVARAVAIAATAWFTLAAAWELFGPLLAGHYASSASMGIIAENMLRWHIPGPVWEYTASKPPPEAYYCHHPWGIFWTTAALMEVFGRHDFVCRLAPVLLSAATPPLLFDLGRRLYRPAAGAAAALAFVVLPIALAFASFNALEVPTITWTLLFLWGLVRLQETAKRRHLAASLVGLFLALNADWPAFVLAGLVLGFQFVRALFLRGAFGPLLPRGAGVPLARRERAFSAFWLASVAITLGTLVLYLGLFALSHKLGDLVGSAELRAGGNQASLANVLASRRYWIELSFTPIAILLGKLGATVIAIRLVWLRREQEALPLCVLGMATVQYVAFKQGADVHVFWPQYFAEYFALAMAALTATLAAGVERAGAFLGPRDARVAALRLGERAGLVALGALSLPLLFVARDGVPALAYARATGGRFNEKGLFIESDGDKTAALAWLAAMLPKTAKIGLSESMRPTWAQVWTLGGRVVSVNRPPPRGGELPDAAWVADVRRLPDGLQRELASHFHVRAVGPVWIVTRAGPDHGAGRDLEAFRVREREPSPFAWYFLSGNEPVREIAPDAEPDPWLTWELRTTYGEPATPPTGVPTSVDETRVALDVAVEARDAASVAARLGDLRAALLPVTARYEDGTEILGATFHDGAMPLLTLYVRAGERRTPELTVLVRSRVVAPARLSTTMADPTERDVGPPLTVPASLWRPGFVYADPVPIRKRPGHEIFRASLGVRGHASGPRRVDAPGDLVVLDLR
jgi:4-amino-4-deoxy-L-arabinose transferase-like glycosyltransferase